MKSVYIVFLISACSLSAMERNNEIDNQTENPRIEKVYQIINQTDHTIQVRIRRMDVRREKLTPDHILVNEQTMLPHQSLCLPHPLTLQWIQAKIPLGIRINHAGTNLDKNAPVDHTPLLAGFQFPKVDLLLYKFIIIHYNQIGKIEVSLQEDNQNDDSRESDNQ